MKLILARHGNTFGPADAPVWVGAGQDMPLVEEGKHQALAVSTYLRHQQLIPSTIYAAPLKRTREFAAIVQEAMMTPVHLEIEPDLTEIDYGRWAGKSNAQIEKTFGATALKDWQERGIWPANANWQPSEEEIIDRTQAFVERIMTHHGEDDTVLAVSSNGILRYFLMLVDGAFERHRKSRSLKVATGNLCHFSYFEGTFHLDAWNQNPKVGAAA